MMVTTPRTDLRVALFATCFNDTMWPETPKATVRLLERLGCRVEFPAAQTCCGQMLTNTGYAGEAVPLVRRFVDVFSGTTTWWSRRRPPCVGSVRDQHAMVARRAGDEGLASEVEQAAPRVHELSEFLVDVLGVTDVGAWFPHRDLPPDLPLAPAAAGGGPAAAASPGRRGHRPRRAPGADECCASAAPSP